MTIRFVSRLLVFAVFLASAAGAAHASGNLDFDGKLSQRQRLLIDGYFKKPAAGRSVAAADLNEDGLNEFIVRQGCKAGLCSYTILAETGGKIIELGALEARNLQLGNAYSGGVRNIVAFKNALNDFDRAVYVWEPRAARYMIKE